MGSKIIGQAGAFSGYAGADPGVRTSFRSCGIFSLESVAFALYKDY